MKSPGKGGREESEKKLLQPIFHVSLFQSENEEDWGVRQLKKNVILLHDMPFLRKIYDPLFFCTSMPFFFPLCCLNADKVIFLTSIKLFFPFLSFFSFSNRK